eukprot:m51a1_g14758 hypothetical protein (452) ;mRNA; f:337878-339367
MFDPRERFGVPGDASERANVGAEVAASTAPLAKSHRENLESILRRANASRDSAVAYAALEALYTDPYYLPQRNVFRMAVRALEERPEDLMAYLKATLSLRTGNSLANKHWFTPGHMSEASCLYAAAVARSAAEAASPSSSPSLPSSSPDALVDAIDTLNSRLDSGSLSSDGTLLVLGYVAALARLAGVEPRRAARNLRIAHDRGLGRAADEFALLLAQMLVADGDAEAAEQVLREHAERNAYPAACRMYAEFLARFRGGARGLEDEGDEGDEGDGDVSERLYDAHVQWLLADPSSPTAFAHVARHAGVWAARAAAASADDEGFRAAAQRACRAVLRHLSHCGFGEHAPWAHALAMCRAGMCAAPEPTSRWLRAHFYEPAQDDAALPLWCAAKAAFAAHAGYADDLRARWAQAAGVAVGKRGAAPTADRILKKFPDIDVLHLYRRAAQPEAQ